MPFGLVPARGDWDYQWFRTDSAATYGKGSLVRLATDYEVVEMVSGASAYLGIAMSHSTASQNIGGADHVMIALPTAGCLAWADLGTNQAQSGFSVGKRITMAKDGNLFSFATQTPASRFSQWVTTQGEIESDLSRVLVSFNLELAQFYSASSVTL